MSTEMDDQDYANLLYHAVEDQLRRRHDLQQFVVNYSSSIVHLVLQLFLSDQLPDKIHFQHLESLIHGVEERCWKLLDVDAKGLPYHDDVLYSQFCLDLTQKAAAVHIPTTPSSLQDPLQPWQGDDKIAQMKKEIFNIYPDFVMATQDLSSVFHWWYKHLNFPRLGRLFCLCRLLMAKAGYKIDKLGFLYGTLHANTVLPPENGYTRVFRQNETVTVEQLRDQLSTSNDAVKPAAFHPFQNFFQTVAVSYKHFADGSKYKMSERDLQALHRFLVASQASNIRFWIDSKLPRTDDDSFDRWLKRGVRPFARYFTFVCPSAFEETDRFWIQMERHIAMASQGIFYCTEDGIYFMKNPFHYRTLCHKMLTMMVSHDGIPPGMRQEDEGKAVQWALGFLGDKDSLKLFRLRGPRVDNLCNTDFCEFTVMRNITCIIREHGELELPVETGRSWNEDNPLILRGMPDQILLLPTWIGFAKSSEPRKVCFLNGSTLTQVIYGGVVGLEVTLRKAFEKGKENEVIRKTLKDIPQSDLLEMRMVQFENGGEKDIGMDVKPKQILQAFLGDVRAQIYDNNGDDTKGNALRLFFREAFRDVQELHFKSDEEPEVTNAMENEERNKGLENSAYIKMKGMKAVAFPWECDWV